MPQWVKDSLRGFGNYLPSNKRISKKKRENIDIAFIGAGLSSTYTLIELLKQLEENISSKSIIKKHSKIRIAIFEKDDWVWGGIPYGRRSGFTSLIITPLDEFLPKNELSQFIDWMSENLDWLKTPFLEIAGKRSRKWFEDSEQKIRSRKSSKIHVPRYFFGLYLLDKLRSSLSVSSFNIELDFINTEVISISKNTFKQTGKFTISSKDGQRFFSEQLLLGVGMPHTRSFKKDIQGMKDIAYFDDPYKPDLETSLSRISHLLSINPNLKILIIGANASSLEMLYQITNLENFEKSNVLFKVLSPQGQLPDLFIKDKKSDFIAENLCSLEESSGQITADKILKAFKKDLAFANNNNYGISDTLPVFTAHVGNLIKKLSHQEKSKFIAFHGIEIGRLQRRAGLEYSQPVNELIESKKLQIIEGKFNNFINSGQEIFVEYMKLNKEVISENFDIVVNCAGSSGLIDDGKSELLKQLIESGLCKPTQSNYGFEVGNNYEVLPGFYINGPLLAGNIIGDMGIWHVEHCGRIIGFARNIAKNILEDDQLNKKIKACQE